MHMKAFLASQPRGTAVRIAELIGCHPSAITRLAQDKLWPQRELWQSIFDVTEGQVTPNDHLTGPTQGAANG